MQVCLGSSLCCSLSAPSSHQARWDAQRSPGRAPARRCFGRGGSIADAGSAAKGPHRPATGRGFQHGETTGWGAAPPQVGSSSRDLLEVILSRWCRNWQGFFNHRPWPAGPGHPHPAQQLQDHPSWLTHGKGSCWPRLRREAVPHPSVFCIGSFSIRWVWLLAFIEEFGEAPWEAEFGVCVHSLLLPVLSRGCVCNWGGKASFARSLLPASGW